MPKLRVQVPSRCHLLSLMCSSYAICAAVSLAFQLEGVSSSRYWGVSFLGCATHKKSTCWVECRTSTGNSSGAGLNVKRHWRSLFFLYVNLIRTLLNLEIYSDIDRMQELEFQIRWPKKNIKNLEAFWTLLPELFSRADGMASSLHCTSKSACNLKAFADSWRRFSVVESLSELLKVSSLFSE